MIVSLWPAFSEEEWDDDQGEDFHQVTIDDITPDEVAVIKDWIKAHIAGSDDFVEYLEIEGHVDVQMPIDRESESHTIFEFILTMPGAKQIGEA